MTSVNLKNRVGFVEEPALTQAPSSASPIFSPWRQKLIKISEKLMTLVGLSGQTLFYFQAYKIYSAGSANDVSVPGFSFALLSLFCWLLYGVLIQNKVLVIVNAFAVIGASLTLIAIYWVS